MVTGLPVPFLLSLSNPSMAQVETNTKFLILSHQQSGDPANANMPGTYADDPADSNDPLNSIDHPRVSELGDAAIGYETPVSFNLGDQTVKGAQPWSTLAEDLRGRMGFWNHGTFVNAHPDFASVRRFNGALKGYDGSGSEGFGSFIAQETHQALATLGSESISLGGASIDANGRTLPILKPNDIKGFFSDTLSNIDQMVMYRDSFIDSAYSDVKENGTPAQKKFLADYGRSRQEAAAMGDSLGELITDVDGNDASNQVKVAVALIQLNIAPVVTLGLEFGGDNHQDINLSNEVTETEQAMLALNTLWDRLKAAGLEDKVVFASLNTFGRTLIRNDTGGRNHRGSHHNMFVFGAAIKPGIVGGIEPNFKDGKIKSFQATGINSVTGSSTGNLDIEYEDTLVSVGKTLAKSIGVSEERINQRIDGGKIITGALV
jgi:hypothetical protein